VLALAEDDVWVVGTGSDSQPITAHWDGDTWLSYGLPGADNGLGSLAALSPGHLWAGGWLRGGEVVAEWNGGTWRVRGRSYWIPDVAVRQTEVWAILNDVVARWNGSKWIPLEKRHPDIALMGLAVDRSGDVWAGGYWLGEAPKQRSVVYRYRCAK